MDNKKLMAWVIIIFMSFSVVGFMGGSLFDNDSKQIEHDYNGYTFFNQSQWQVKIAENNYAFTYFPGELENIYVPNVGGWLSAPKIYLGFEPSQSGDIKKYSQLLGSLLYLNDIIVQQACTIEEGCGDFPIMNCDNLGIILAMGEENSFIQKDNCLVMTGKDRVEMQKLTERLIYQLLGVMG